MRLTRRGWVLVGTVLLAGLVAALVFAFNTGQDKQCAWFKAHGTAIQVSEYCGP